MTKDFSDLFTCDLRKGMMNRKSQSKEIRTYILSIYAFRKGYNDKKEKYYALYLKIYYNQLKLCSPSSIRIT